MIKTNMFNWNTNKISLDLGYLPQVKKIKVTGPTGSFDTCGLTISIKGAKEHLYVSGYLGVDKELSEINNTPAKWVVLSDGGPPPGGLRSTSPTVKELYDKILQYFLERDVVVVGHFNEIH